MILGKLNSGKLGSHTLISKKMHITDDKNKWKEESIQTEEREREKEREKGTTCNAYSMEHREKRAFSNNNNKHSLSSCDELMLGIAIMSHNRA